MAYYLLPQELQKIMRNFFLLVGTCLSQEVDKELGTAETIKTMAYGTCMFYGLWGLGLWSFRFVLLVLVKGQCVTEFISNFQSGQTK